MYVYQQLNIDPHSKIHMVNDPIGDMIIQLKNAGLSGKLNVEIPYSKIKRSLADILKKERYVSDISKIGKEPRAFLKVTLRYLGKSSAIAGVKRVSKPGARLYVRKEAVPSFIKGTGVAILSTSKGIMTNADAKKNGLGGEILCEVW